MSNQQEYNWKSLPRRKRVPILVGLLAVALVLILTGCGLLLPTPFYETTSVGIAVSGGPSGSLQASFSIGGTGAAAARSLGSSVGAGPLGAVIGAPDPADITLVTLTITGEDRFGVFQDPLATATLTQVGGVWQATVDNLPIGPSLSFGVSAFDAGGTELYSGSSTRVLGGAGETINIALYPVTDATPVFFPVIERITRPAEIVVDTTETVSVDLAGTADETLSVEFTSGGGSFTPNPASVALPSSGAGTLDAAYGAPSVPDTYTHSVKVTNSQGNSVQTQFPTVVVYETGSATITIGIAPAVIGLSASRSGSDVTYTATVTDDAPLSELTYAWSFVQSGGTPGATFAPAAANPATLTGYDETVSGTVELVVTDGDGLSTTVTFGLPAGQFPDTVVAAPPAVMPIVPITEDAIFWVATDFSEIRRANLDGTGVTTILSGLHEPRNLVVDAENGIIYWNEGDGSSPTEGAIKRAPADGSFEETIDSGFGSSTALALDLQGFFIYYDRDGVLYSARTDGSEAPYPAAPWESPPPTVGYTGIDFDPNRQRGENNTYLARPGEGIYSFLDNTKDETFGLLQASPSPQGVAVDEGADLLFWTDPANAAGKVRRAPLPSAWPVTDIAVATGTTPTGIDVDPVSGTVYWSDANGAIYEMDRYSTGAATPLIADRASDVAVVRVNIPTQEVLVTGSNSSLYRGNGIDPGTWTVLIPLPGNPVYSSTVADFNDDGTLDFVAAFFDRIALFANDGTGNFTESTIATAPAVGDGMTTGDYNRDGLPDVFVAYNLENDVVLLNNGNGSFTTVDLGVNPYKGWEAETADFNNDGIDDVFVVNFQNFNYVYIGDGTGGFSATRLDGLGSGSRDVAIADFNSDGALDVFDADGANVAESGVYFGDNTGGFSPPSPVTGGSSTFSATAGDFDSDGDIDIATAGFWNRPDLLFINDGFGNFTYQYLMSDPSWLATSTRVVEAYDLTADGNLDLLIGTSSMYFATGDGNGNFTRHTMSGFFGTPQDIHVGDFDQTN